MVWGRVVDQSRKCEACFAASRLGACLMALVSRSRSSHLPRLPPPPEDLKTRLLMTGHAQETTNAFRYQNANGEYSTYFDAVVRCESFHVSTVWPFSFTCRHQLSRQQSISRLLTYRIY
jgi:hypothetical protein